MAVVNVEVRSTLSPAEVLTVLTDFSERRAEAWPGVDLEHLVVHETGPAAGREKRCAAAYPDVDVLVFGHSHIPWDTTAPTGLRLLNPGSPTDRRRQPDFTWMTAETAGGRLGPVTLHRLPPPAR